ncbi:MAG TPA: endonuclease/exonuclease/phosphatase family protein, partial [Casimicrobiaceae bacterium]|nr:endonuclease/exonuclease/phosphatase family protein [Casimicrobiaceae bacterium]
LAQLLPGYTAVPAIAVDQPAEGGRRRRFGNLILSRLPVRQVYRHLLPYPCDPGVPGMPRIALEAVVAAPLGDLRVVTTHLEYYSAMQRMAQVEALRRIYADGHAHARDARITIDDGGPFHTFLRPRPALVVGDCNFEPDSDEYLRMLAGFGDATPPLFDAWRQLHRDLPHPTTFKLHEKTVPDEPELHCDFVFVSDELRARLRGVRVDLDTQASDHQPIVVTLA